MLVNFRDIGDTGSGNRSLKKGIFFRGGQLTDLTEDDKRQLKKQYCIRKIYDFRNQQELTNQPDDQIDGIDYENIDILASLASNENAAALQNMMNNFDNIHEAMMTTYKNLVISESALQGYSNFLTEILTTKQPIYFHCFAGKDRTGFAAALLLKIAGVPESEIMKDYLETNTSRKEANQIIINAMKHSLNEQQLEGLKIALTVDENYLIYAKKILIAHYGSFENYLIKGLSLGEDYIEQFQELYVE